MKKLSTFIMLLIVAIFYVQAQPYTLSTVQMPYQKLTGGTSINGTTPWFIPKLPIDLPFSVKLGKTTTNKLYTDGGGLYADTVGADVDYFQYVYTGTIDKGDGTGTSKSPLRYTVTGNTGSRIFKMESLNMGFYTEQQMYGTFLDSFNCQFWIYEGTNVVEIHFGDAKISHPLDYFIAGAPAFSGYFSLNLTPGGPPNYAYVAAGDPLNPVLDSLTATHFPDSLLSYPTSGTVYRFTPNMATATDDMAQTLPVKAYPTRSNGLLNVEYGGQEKAHYQVLTLLGADMNIKGDLQAGNNQLNITNLPTGIYLLQISTSTALTTLRVVKI